MTGAENQYHQLFDDLRVANESLVIASLKAQELQDEAEAANYRQTEFLSMLAHELRNPLAPIGMAAEMLQRIAHAHPQLPNIHDIIERQVAHMKRLLEDLLDASRVVTGKVNLVAQPLRLQDILLNAADIAKPALDGRHQPLVMDLPEAAVVIQGDAVRLSQVFSNLLLNASKYTPGTDPITVSVRLNGLGQVEVSVKDHGVGIEPEIQPFVFDLFVQANLTLARSEGGLGIGLSMVRTLTELHGGSVTVRSDGIGRGSEFVVTLPVSNEVAPLPPAVHIHLPAARAARILVIEDNVDGNETLNFCLSTEGHQVESAFDGKQGVDMAIAGNYDIIFCDIGLPGMDGYEVIRQVHAHCPGPVPYCVAMTGYDQGNYRDRADKVGFNQFLVKPVAIDQLLDIVAATTSKVSSSI
jgi:two-component system CheB/CheR fusion protein